MLGYSRKQIAWNAAQSIQHGSYINLGIGMPVEIANHVPEDRTIIYHTENGVLGFGPAPKAEDIDYDLINASKQPITLLKGASIFHHADSFAMIRGGHLDGCFLGAMQVAYNGDLANWRTNDPDAIPAVGGAMDLVNGAPMVGILMEHTTKKGAPKLLSACTFPLTGTGKVTKVFTNYGIFLTSPEGFIVDSLAPDVSLAQVRNDTDAPVICADDVPIITAPELD